MSDTYYDTNDLMDWIYECYQEAYPDEPYPGALGAIGRMMSDLVHYRSIAQQLEAAARADIENRLAQIGAIIKQLLEWQPRD